jgi:lipopolysaccharide export system protein LptA
MLKRHFSKITLLALAIAVLGPSYALCAPKKGLLNGPIVITSSTLSADSANNIAVFEGSVVASADDLTLHSDRMTVFYNSEGDIEKIDASGNIKLVKDTRVLTSKKAIYVAEEAKITFTGEPMAVEGSNIITGSKIIYLVEEDRSIVHDSKVYIDRDKVN